MKIAIVNTYDNKGGAAIAARRMYEALKDQNIDVEFFVQDNQLPDFTANTLSKIKKVLNFIRFSAERLKILLHIKERRNLYAFDSATFGEDITKNPVIKNADIIHLHWINFGFLSLKSLKKILSLNKPVFWTFHDMWPVTGGCFYARSCDKYTKDCKNCPLLKKSSNLAKRVFEKKKKIYNQNIIPVAISSWSKNNIETSALLRENRFFWIPNPVKIDKFKPLEKVEIRKKLSWTDDKIYLGFVAFNLNSVFKGADLLKNALNLLVEEHPEIAEKINLVAIGKYNQPIAFSEKINVIPTGYISEESKMVEYFNALDIFILPSEEENLPLVIQEAMSCGTPVVAFDVGGVKDMIDHKKNGYVAEAKNYKDLKNGIYELITDDAKRKEYSQNARKKMVEKFSYEVVAKQMIEAYQSVLNHNS